MDGIVSIIEKQVETSGFCLGYQERKEVSLPSLQQQQQKPDNLQVHFSGLHQRGEVVGRDGTGMGT